MFLRLLKVVLVATLVGVFSIYYAMPTWADEGSGATNGITEDQESTVESPEQGSNEEVAPEEEEPIIEEEAPVEEEQVTEEEVTSEEEQVTAEEEVVIEETAPEMEKWGCTTCGYVYDPDVGDPDHGIEPGTAFEDLPDDWVCPGCGAEKNAFEKQ